MLLRGIKQFGRVRKVRNILISIFSKEASFLFLIFWWHKYFLWVHWFLVWDFWWRMSWISKPESISSIVCFITCTPQPALQLSLFYPLTFTFSIIGGTRTHTTVCGTVCNRQASSLLGLMINCWAVIVYTAILIRIYAMFGNMQLKIF